MPNAESTHSSCYRRLKRHVAGLRQEYIVYGISFALALTFFGLFFQSAWGDYRHTPKESYITAGSYNKILEEYVLRTMGAIDILLAGEVEQIKMYPSAAEIRGADYGSRLARTTNAIPAVWSLVVLDGSGLPLAESRSLSPPPEGYSEMAFFRTHREETNADLFIGTPFYSPSAERWFIGFSRRLPCSDGRFCGAIMALVSPGFMKKFIADMNISPDSLFALIRSDGMVLASEPPGSLKRGEDLSGNSLFSRFIYLTQGGVYETADDMKLAMEKFQQVDSSLNRSYEGSGLGLPLAAGFVEIHGGTLEMESVVDKGTTVRVRLPRERLRDADGSLSSAGL